MISSTNSNLVNSFLASKSATPIKKQKEVSSIEYGIKIREKNSYGNDKCPPRG